MLKHYPADLVPRGTRRVVEPYLGAGSYSLACLDVDDSLTVLGFDTSKDVVDLWHWLQGANVEDELMELQVWYDRQTEKVDIRTVPCLTPGMRLYLKVNVCGAYVGQLSSWTIYPLQHRLPLLQTLAALPVARRVEAVLGEGEAFRPECGDFVFVDPPYVGTQGNYTKKGFDPRAVDTLLAAVDVPMMMTYGDGAPDLFPSLSWQVACVRKVPVLRGGGTVLRTEYYARRGWS